MTGFGKVLMALALNVLQWFMLPSFCHTRPDSEAWGFLLFGSLMAFFWLSMWLAMLPQVKPLRTCWRLSFLLYIGTIGSAAFKAPDIAAVLLILSTPTIATRCLLNSSHHAHTSEWQPPE